MQRLWLEHAVSQQIWKASGRGSTNLQSLCTAKVLVDYNFGCENRTKHTAIASVRLSGCATSASCSLPPTCLGAMMTPAAAAMLSKHANVNGDEQQAERA